MKRQEAATLALFACLLSGCGESLPETTAVQGTILFAGQPLTDGTVTFHPLNIPEGLPQRPARGNLDPQGAFQLSTFRSGDGAVPGTYRVTVHSYLNRPNKFDDSGNFVPQWRIPERYGDPVTSQLIAEVPPGEPTAEITLTLDE